MAVSVTEPGVAAAMAIEKFWVAGVARPLDAVMVPVNVPAAVGVPEITPVELSDNPLGKLPAVTANVTGVVPITVQV